MIEIKIKKSDGFELHKNIEGKDITLMPQKMFSTSAGADIRYWGDNPRTLQSGATELFPTGFKMEIPDGFEAQIRSRSGLSKKGIIVANSPGTIDSEYRGDVGVLLHNNSEEEIFIHPGERIAQMVIQKIPEIEYSLVEELSETSRGVNGFGSTGTK